MRPEFWQDEEVAAWPEGLRLFYIGLWGCCDDAGFFEYVPSRIAALIYPYDSRRRRESKVMVWLSELEKAGKVTRFEGCQHAVIPTLKLHQKTGGAPSYTVKKAHDGEIRSPKENPVSNVTIGKGKERGGTGGSESPTEGSAFDSAMAAAGGRKP